MAKFVTMYMAMEQIRQVDLSEEGEVMDGRPDVKLSPVNPFDTELEPGQVRLLGGDTDRMTYVALLKRWEADSFVVMPFSAFKYPATDEEFMPEYDGGVFQHVLQAWNVRTLDDASLKRSWVVGQLSEKDMDDAWRLWEKSLGGKELDDELLKRTGLPIYKLHDPRLKYKQTELVNMGRWVQQV